MHVLLALFLFIVLLSSLMTAFIGDFTLDYVLSRSPARIKPWIASYTAFLALVLGISAFYVTAVCVNNRVRLRRALRWWVVGATGCSVAAIYGAFAAKFNWPLASIFPEYPDPNRIGRIYGFTQEPREFAIFLSTVLPLVLIATLRRAFFMRPWLQRFCLILVGAAFLMTLSRSTMVLTVVIVGLLLFLPLLIRGRTPSVARQLPALVIAMGGTILIVQMFLVILGLPSLGEIAQEQFRSFFDNSGNYSNLMQLVSYEVAWRTFAEHPILGVGIGNFPFYIDRHMPSIPFGPQWEWLYAEGQYGIAGISNNAFLDMLSQVGILGTFAFVCVLAYPAVKAWRALRRVEQEEHRLQIMGLLIGYLALLVAQLFSSVFTYAYCWATMGLLYAAVRVNDPAQASSVYPAAEEP
jgi:O-antigen ligase